MAVRDPIIEEGHFAFDIATLEASVGYNNQRWSELTKIGVPEAPKDGKPYFMINGQWVAATNVIVDPWTEISSSSSVSTELGDNFTYQIAVTSDDEPVQNAVYSIENAPEGMTVNASTGVVSWSVPSTAATVGSHTFTVKATLEDNSVVSQVVTVTATVPQSFQPVIEPNQSITVTVNEAMTPYQIRGSNLLVTETE